MSKGVSRSDKLVNPTRSANEHGHFTSPAGHRLCARLREHVFQDSRVDVLAEGLLQALLGTQFFHEKIKRIGQSSHLVGRTDRQLEC